MKSKPRKKPRKPVERIVTITDWSDIAGNLRWAAHNLNHCAFDLEVIDDLLTSIYKLGFAHGAVASRRTFTRWKAEVPFSPKIATKHAVESFVAEMVAVHRIREGAPGTN